MLATDFAIFNPSAKRSSQFTPPTYRMFFTGVWRAWENFGEQDQWMMFFRLRATTAAPKMSL